MWTFIKLDTATGKLSHVQYGVGDTDSFEYKLSDTDLTDQLGKWSVKGRYKLYSTQNRWTFIMVDTLDGDTYQVQWGDHPGIAPIPLGIAKFSKGGPTTD